MDFAFSLRLFFFAGVAKVNSHGWLFGKQGREERDRFLVEMKVIRFCICQVLSANAEACGHVPWVMQSIQSSQ